MKTVKIGDTEYFAKSDPRGYGYLIMSLKKIDGKRIFKSIFNSFDKMKVTGVFDQMLLTEAVPTTFPETSDEVPPIKILVHRAKHSNDYYDVSTKDKLEKTCRHILKRDQFMFCKPEAPKNESGVESHEELEKLEFNETIFVNAKNQFEEYKRKEAKYKSENSDWNRYEAVIKGEGSFYDVLDVMGEFGQDWEIEDVREVIFER